MVGKDIAICIAGNKSDLERNRQVSTEEGKAYAASVDAAYYNTSAKLNRGIDDCFLELAKREMRSPHSRRRRQLTRWLSMSAEMWWWPQEC